MAISILLVFHEKEKLKLPILSKIFKLINNQSCQSILVNSIMINLLVIKGIVMKKLGQYGSEFQK